MKRVEYLRFTRSEVCVCKIAGQLLPLRWGAGSNSPCRCSEEGAAVEIAESPLVPDGSRVRVSSRHPARLDLKFGEGR